MTSIALPVLGLAGDQNPSAAPKGALSEADNVVCDLPGQARPRPNNSVVYSNGSAVSRCDAVLSFDGEWLAHDTTDGWRNALGELTELSTVGTASATDITQSEPQGAMARGSMYIANVGGVARVESPTATAIEAAGMDIPFAPSWPNVPNITNLSPGPFTAPVSVAYRAVLKRRDANGYVKRSPPTPAYVVRDAATMSSNAFIIAGPAADERWYFGDSTGQSRIVALKAGDEVEFYRTKSIASSTAAIPPDYYLVKTYTVTATDVTNGYIAPAADLLDDVADDQLGEALYTNPAQGGALAAKYNPPLRPVAIAQWNRCLWVGNGREGALAALTFQEGTALDSVQITAGSITSGLATITGVASVTGISVGMFVTDSTATGPLAVATGVIPWSTQVLSISGAGPYTITMTKNATGNLTLSGINDVKFYHAIFVDGVAFVADASGDYNPRHFPLYTTDAGRTAVAFAAAVRVATAKGLEVWETGTAANFSAFSVADSGSAVGSGAPGLVAVGKFQGEDFDVETTAASGVVPLPPNPLAKEFAATSRPNRLWWSAPDEPEAFPLLNYVDLGDERAAIQRIVPLRDALLVFTTMGLYRVTGTPPGSWSVDLLDASLRLVRAECVDVLDGDAYAFTNRGVVQVNESGVVRDVGDGKVQRDIEDAMHLCIDDPSKRGARVVCWERMGLVLVSLPTAASSPTSSEVLCYCPKTGAWTRWPNQYWSAGCSDGIAGNPFFASTRADAAPLYEIRQMSDETRGYDHVWSAVAVTSGAGTTTLVISDAARGSWYPMDGDWILVGTEPDVFRRVLTAVDNGATWSLTLDAAAPNPLTDFDAYEGAPVLLEWLPSVLGSGAPFTLPVWREASVSFYGLAGGKEGVGNARLTFGVRHDFSNTPVEVTGTPERSTVQLRPYRFGWPRNAARRAVCFPRLSFSELEWDVRIAGLMVVGEGGTERTRQ